MADRLSPDLAARVLVECTTEESTLLQGDYDSTGHSCSNSEDETVRAKGTGTATGSASAGGSALTASIAADVIRFTSDRAASSSTVYPLKLAQLPYCIRKSRRGL